MITTFDSSISFRSYAESWLQLHPVAPRTRQDYSKILERYVYPSLGDFSLSDLRFRVLQTWLVDTAGVSWHQARQARSVVSQILALAVREGLLSENPALGLRLPPGARSLPTPLTAAQVAAVHHHLPTQRDQLLFLVLVLGGLRFSEAAGLSPDDVRPDFLLVSRSVQPRHGGGVMVGDLKTHQARRVYLPAALMSALHDYAEDRSAPFLFSSRVGTPIDRGNWAQRVLRPACEAAGVPPITPHALRDTCATLALEAGLPAQVVAAHLGHADATTTLRHYAGVLPTQRLKLASSLGSLFESVFAGDHSDAA